MTVKIYLSEEFKRQFKRLAKKDHSLTNDFKVFMQAMETDPMQGVDLGNNMRKVRARVAVQE